MSKSVNWRNHKVFLLGLVVLLAFFLRFYNLTFLPVFVDEAIYIRWSQVMISVPSLRFLPLSDGKQPLFMWVLMLVVRSFSDPLFIGRLISVVSGLLTIMGIFALSYVLFKSKLVALISATLWAISPFAVFFDRMALVDSMLTMLGAWTFFFAVLMVKTKRISFAVFSGLTLGLAMLTKSPAIFLLFLIPSTWILTSKPIQLIKLGFLTGVVWVIAFGMYNILRLDPNFHLLASRNLDYIYPYDHVLTSPLNPLFGHLGGIWNYFVQFAPIGLVVLVVLGILGSFAKHKREVIFLLIIGLAPILITAEYSKVVTARYILFTLPYLFILASSASLVKKKIFKSIALVFFAIFVVHSLYIDLKLLTDVKAAPLPHGERNGYLEEWTAGQGIKEISEYIKAEHARDPEIKIVTGTEGYFGTLPNGLEMYLEGVDNVITIGVGLGIQELPKSLKESRDAGNKTYLVVNKSRLVGDPDKMGLRELMRFEKPPRMVGSKEYIEKGPQEILYFFKVGYGRD